MFFVSRGNKGVRGEFRRALRRVLDTGEKICIDLKGHELLELLPAIAAFLITMHVIVWHPVALGTALAIAVYLHKNGYFDKLCNVRSREINQNKETLASLRDK